MSLRAQARCRKMLCENSLKNEMSVPKFTVCGQRNQRCVQAVTSSCMYVYIALYTRCMAPADSITTATIQMSGMLIRHISYNVIAT